MSVDTTQCAPLITLVSRQLFCCRRLLAIQDVRRKPQIVLHAKGIGCAFY